MTSSQISDAERIIETTLQALSRKDHYQSAPDVYNLARDSSQIALYGKDAAEDFIATKWSLVVAYLISMGAAKNTAANIQMPEMGYQAKERVEQFFRDHLSRFEVKSHGSFFMISWNALIKTR